MTLSLKEQIKAAIENARNHGYPVDSVGPMTLYDGILTYTPDLALQNANEVFAVLQEMAAYKEMIGLAKHITKMGYAVVIFTPEELKGVDADILESHMIEKGNEWIDTWGDSHDEG